MSAMDVARAAGRSALAAVERGWFTPAPARRLAAARLVHGTWNLWYLGKRRKMLRKVHRTDERMFEPVGLCRVLREPLPPRVADTILDATLISIGAATAGVAYPISGPVSAALLTWTMSYRNSWSMIYHSNNLPVLHGMALGAGRSADALSVDALLRGAFLGPRDEPAGGDARYGWPLRLASATTTATYSLSAVAKLAAPSGGWAWTTGESLRRQVAVDGIRKEALGGGASPLFYRLYNQTGLFRWMAVCSLLLELLAPLALLDRRLARLWAVAAWGMHVGILAIMKITFRYPLTGATYASVMPLERAVDAVTGTVTRSVDSVAALVR